MDGHGNDCQASLRHSGMTGEDRPASTEEHRLDGTERGLGRRSGVRVWRASAETWPCGSAIGHDDALRLQETAILAQAVGGFWAAAGGWAREKTRKTRQAHGTQAPAAIRCPGRQIDPSLG